MLKECITFSLCTRMTVEKEPIVVIGKSINPRCFKKVPVSNLRVKYYSTKVDHELDFRGLVEGCRQ